MQDLNSKPRINIGMLGSVSDGKSTCVRQLTGTKTQRYSSEQERNITIKPGYANMKVWTNENDDIVSTDSKVYEYEGYNLVDHISFLDCPGHNELILTMLGSVKLMNAVILVVSLAEPLERKPQLVQHIASIKLSGIKKVIVCANKLDLISKDVALERYNNLVTLLNKYEINPLAIIPTSFSKNIGTDWLLEEILKHFNFELESTDNTQFLAIRSFDINKPSTDYKDIQGGVIGGSLLQGKLHIGDEIEIRPGICSNKNGEINALPIITTVLSMRTEKEELNEISVGGLIGIGTDIDPFYCKDDMLSGNIIGLRGTLPPIYNNVTLSYQVLTDFVNFEWSPKVNDNVYLQIGTMLIPSTITNTKKRTIQLKLLKPACIDNNSNIIICKKETGSTVIVAIANLKKGNIIV